MGQGLWVNLKDNPDDINKTSSKVAPRDAFVVGLKLSINANQLLGLPQSLPGVRGPGL